MQSGGERQRFRVGILSTEFVGSTAEEGLGYEAASLVRACKAQGADSVLLDPARVALGVEKDSAWAGYVDGAELRRDHFDHLDVLLVRRTRAHDRGVSEMIYDLVPFLQHLRPDLVILDPPSCFLHPLSKVPAMLARARAGVKQGDRLVVSRELAARVELPMSFPVITKPPVGRMGCDVTAARDANELAMSLTAEPDEPRRFAIMVERWLAIDDEFRVIVVGGRSVGCARKRDTGKVTRNVATGGVWEGAADPRAEGLAIEATMAEGYAFAGVDIVRSGSEDLVIECNRSPQFEAFDRATEVDVGAEIVRFALSRLA